MFDISRLILVKHLQTALFWAFRLFLEIGVHRRRFVPEIIPKLECQVKCEETSRFLLEGPLLSCSEAYRHI